jgi:AcrR family transcriptional regulator
MMVAESRETSRVLEWVRQPLQARTRESLTRMLDAAEELVARKGFNDTSITEIARRAGSSVGGFYRRFRDKQGLLQAVHARFCDEARATADAALDPSRWAGAPTAEVLTEFTAFLVRIYRAREGSFRAFLISGVADETVRCRTHELFAHLHDRLCTLLAERRTDVGHPEPDLASAVALHFVIGALNHSVQLQPPALGLADARLPGELARAFLAYLGVRASIN